MSTRLKLSLCGLLVAAAVGTTAYVITDFSTQASAADNTAAVNTVEAEGYVLREYNGNVAIYKPGGKSPVSITDIEIITLREVDQKSLDSGITVKTQDELFSLLEDFGS